jgi:HEAT repeat protein
MVYSCRSTTDLVLDDPVFLEDMVRAALNNERFVITPEDYPGIQQLIADERADYRMAALIMALQANDEALIPVVVTAALDENQDVADAALDAMIQDTEVYIPYLLNLLERGNSQDQIDALRLLASVGGEGLVPLFIEYFADTDPDVRNQASISVRTVATRDNSFLRDALDDPDPLSASIAYRTLGRYADPDDMPVFIEAFTSRSSEVRREAQLAALRTGESGLPFLHIVASDPIRPYRSRLSSLEVIQGLRSTESLPTLIDLLDDENERIVLKVNSILGTYGSEAVPALADLYDVSDEDFRVHAVRLMGEIRAPAALPTLMRALDDQSQTVRLTAAVSVEAYGEDAWPSLRSLISAESGPFGRRTALRLLRRGADPLLAVDENDTPNIQALLLLITESEKEQIEEYLTITKVSRLRAETILSLKEAWEIAEEFVALDEAISEGTDPYLYAWRRRELFAVAGREALEQSFEELHAYFETRDSAILEKARVLRAESRRLEDEARKQRDIIESMSAAVKAAGEVRLTTYRSLRDQLVRTWQYSVPELRPLAQALYAQQGLDPAALSRESALLN